MINEIGIEIDINEFIKENYNCISRKYVKICDGTNFHTGHIAYDDLVFLPDNTYIRLIQNDSIIYGKIFHFNWDFENKHAIKYGTAIVHIDYDMNSSKDYFDLNRKKIYFCIEKNIYINKNKNMEYAQVVKFD